ncbi:hypothetical protein DUI87_15602 [Hirundo rustica rustica]|uniref:Uncharacterized protein n=1 Tax=Hirundo rustica rustica TaxID=333673 RepID=A0A3M0JYT1_HIRRU|nr:hypothetical protein DUI87_15602 [Hirundo rustica rustica]
MCMWHLRTWFIGEHGDGVELMAGLDDLRGVFQPYAFYDPKLLHFTDKTPSYVKMIFQTSLSCLNFLSKSREIKVMLRRPTERLSMAETLHKIRENLLKDEVIWTSQAREEQSWMNLTAPPLSHPQDYSGNCGQGIFALFVVMLMVKGGCAG